MTVPNYIKISALSVAISMALPSVASEVTTAASSLKEALVTISEAHNVAIYAEKSSLALMTSKAKSTEADTKEAIKAAISGTNLIAHWVDASTIVIQPMGSDVNKNLINKKYKLTPNQIENITVYGRHNALVLNSGTATKSNMDLMQTPAAVVIVEKALLDDQATSTLQDALRNISGLTQAGNNYGIGDNLIIRGLGSNYTYDGMYGGADLSNSYNPTRSTTNIESVEVLKGPATGLYGIGAAGGVINLVEKKPQDTPAYKMEAKIGQWNERGIMFDATSAITDDLAYRLVLNTESKDGYRDLSSKRDEIYATLRHHISDDQKISITVASINDENQVDSVGHPVRILNLDSINTSLDGITGADLPNDPTDAGLQLTEQQRDELANSIANTDGSSPFDLGKQGVISPLSSPNKGKELRVKLKHEIHFDQGLSITQQLQYRDYDSSLVRQTGAYNYVYWNRRGVTNANPRAPLVIDDVLYPFAARRQEYRKQESSEKGWQYFADLNKEWSIGDINGEHLVSINGEDRDMRAQSWSIYDADGNKSGNAIPYILDIRNPNWPTGKFDDYDPVLRSNYKKSVSAYGISAQEVIYLNEQLTARIGAAYSTVKQQYQHLGTPRTPTISQEADSNDSGNTFNLGLNYRFNDNIATFINYSKGQTAYSILGSVTGTSDDRPNSESTSLYIGLRFTALDDNLLGSFVYFDTSITNLRRNNELYNDNIDDDEYNIDVQKYFYDNEDNTKGVEFDINLALSDQWSMNANATYQDAIEIRNQNSDPRSGQRKGIPRVFASIWLSYSEDMFGLSSPFKFNVGVSHTGERTINSTSFGLPESTVDAYTVLDAGISYETPQWKAQLNLNNLTNETYYTKALFIGGLPGDSRNAKLTVSYKF